ncbi:MAG TPA: OFA family MFS transporter, partial [Sedimentisphaerales bacterium]|nr:OFA family MFS transporter [Sedimentisphaerales bacterium]
SVLGGIGIGIAYVCPVATCVKWFPDKRGLITGLAVMGFGAGAFFFAPLAQSLISGSPYTLLNVPLFPMPQIGVFNTFLSLGLIFLVTVVGGAQLLRNPPAGYVPAGWQPAATTQTSAVTKVDYTAMEMLRTPNFWLLWVTFFISCTAGLMVIMKASPIWQSFSIGTMSGPIQEDVYIKIATAGALAVSILAIFNALSRILWGKISDSLGRKSTLIIIAILCGVTMLMLDWMRVYPLYLLGVSVVGLCFGGHLALYPALTADLFGTKHIGANYGWIFSAFGAGGFAGPYLAARLMRITGNVPYLAKDDQGMLVEKIFEVGNYRTAFFVAGVGCLAAAGLTMLIKTDRPSS